MGYSQEMLNHTPAAMILYLRAIKYLESDERIAQVNNNIANLLTSMGLYEEADFYLNDALMRCASESQWKMRSNYNRARNFRLQKQYDSAVNTIYKAEQLATGRKDYDYLLRVMNEKGLILCEKGETMRAGKVFWDLIDLKDANKNYELKSYDKYAGKAYHNLAHLSISLNDTTKAIKFLTAAIDKKSTDAELFISYKDLGEVYLSKGEKDKSQIYLKKAMTILPTRIPVTSDDLILYKLMSLATDDQHYLLSGFDHQTRFAKIHKKDIGELIMKLEKLENQHASEVSWYQMLEVILALALIILTIIFLYRHIRKKSVRKSLRLYETHMQRKYDLNL